MFVVLYNYHTEFDGYQSNRLVSIVPSIDEAIMVAKKFYSLRNYSSECEIHSEDDNIYSVLVKYNNSWDIDDKTFFEILPIEKILEKINLSVDKMID